MTQQEKRAAYYEKNKDKWRLVYHAKPERTKYMKEYCAREDVRERRKAYMREYYALRKKTWNAGKTPEQKRADNEQRKARKRTDAAYRIRCNLRSRLAAAIRGRFKHYSAVRDIGCSIDALKKRIESQFMDGWTWDNYGSAWSLDHIYPLSLVDFECPVEFKAAIHYMNIRPVAFSENSRKSNRATEKEALWFERIKTLVTTGEWLSY